MEIPSQVTEKQESEGSTLMSQEEIKATLDVLRAGVRGRSELVAGAESQIEQAKIDEIDWRRAHRLKQILADLYTTPPGMRYFPKLRGVTISDDAVLIHQDTGKMRGVITVNTKATKVVETENGEECKLVDLSICVDDEIGRVADYHSVEEFTMQELYEICDTAIDLVEEEIATGDPFDDNSRLRMPQNELI